MESWEVKIEKAKEATKIESVEALRSNIKHLKNIINELSVFLNQFYVLGSLEARGVKVKKEEKKLINDTIISLVLQLRIINNSIPELIKSVSFFKQLPKFEEKPAAKVSKKKGELVSLQYQHPTVSGAGGETFLTIKKQDKLRFLKELRLTEESVRRLKKSQKIKIETYDDFKKPSDYARISNRYFSKTSMKLLDKGYFKEVSRELRKANMYYLTHTYVSMALLTSVIVLFLSIILVGMLLFFNFSLDFTSFITRATGPIYLRFFKFFWLIFALPILTLLAFYFYPSTERKSIAGKIEQELPFVAIHMSAIAGSGVEPTKIFRIIVTSREYKNTKKEFKKLLNDINVYGYDLVTALRNTARVTSSPKLAELFNGLATTITSGGNLKEFLDKRAETLVFEYKMEREKYTRMAETFMDIYISVVIAAPMILTMLLVMMSLIQIGINIPPITLGVIIIMIIALINVVFLVFLHLRQPEGG